MPPIRTALFIAGITLFAGMLRAEPPSAGAAPAAAPAAPRSPGVPVFGVIRRIEGRRVTVELKDGSSAILLLTPTTVLTVQTKAAFADIKPHDFVASAGILGADGRTHAQEVRIFPESMRGVGEGHTPMALPNQTMTNATVASVGGTMTNATVSTVGSGVLTTVYPGGTTDIVVDRETPVWAISTVDASRLTPGTSIRAFTVKDADGNLTARYVALL